MEIDASAFYRFAERVEGAEQKLDSAFIAAGNEASKKGVDIARAILASNGSIVTGGLAGSIQARPTTRSGDTFTASYGPTEEYPARWVEEGRGPVAAAPGHKLRFQIKGAGPYLYRQRVGPARARPFMRPSVRRLRPIATKLFGDKVLQAVNGML